MIFTWVRNGKPDVSMCLNASLAGLVGITAGCDALDALGSFIVGMFRHPRCACVELLDLKLHIDDPVGAVAVHMANGIWGTIAVGLFSNPDAPAGLTGLFYGEGGAYQLGIRFWHSCHYRMDFGLHYHYLHDYHENHWSSCLPRG